MVMFPILKNKKFYELSTGKIITVVDQFEDVAVLEGKQRININKLLDNSFFEEHIDPQSFFNGNSLQTLAEKIKSIPNDVLSNLKEDDGPIVMPYDPEEEKQLLLEKAKSMAFNNSFESQMEKFKDLIDEDAFIRAPQSIPTEPVIRIDANRPEIQLPQVSEEKPELPRIVEIPQVQSTQVIPEDPMTKMFRNIKRKNDFKFTLTIENKIPRPDFIEMMEDSYEVSLIDFLADEFTNQLLENPDFIKEKIKQEISDIVFKKEKVEKPVVAKEEKQEILHEQVPEKKVTKTKNKKNNDTLVAD